MTAKAQALRDALGVAALLVTRSEEGMSLYTADGADDIPAVAREVYDVSGAGDTVIAALGALLGAGADLHTGGAHRERSGRRRRRQARNRGRDARRARVGARALAVAKAKTVYSCTECGGQSPKWQGQCPHCNAWNTLVETVAAPPATRFQTVAGKAIDRARRSAPSTPRRARGFRPASRNSTACWAAGSCRAA